MQTINSFESSLETFESNDTNKNVTIYPDKQLMLNTIFTVASILVAVVAFLWGVKSYRNQMNAQLFLEFTKRKRQRQRDEDDVALCVGLQNLGHIFVPAWRHRMRTQLLERFPSRIEPIRTAPDVLDSPLSPVEQ